MRKESVEQIGRVREKERKNERKGARVGNKSKSEISPSFHSLSLSLSLSPSLSLPLSLSLSPFLPSSSLRKTKITRDTTARAVVLTADRPVRAPTDPFCRPLDFVATLIPWNRSLRPQGSRLQCTVQYACYPERDSERKRERMYVSTV